ncbi:TlpA family protein disulfide reductase [Microterricola viridarii]|uniref:Thioredoxin domain-containing protein n=1 Tax=Microterricola viridarii TaxID=412690 RepID=A0A0X8E4P3_9MICO|nr:thioredoxin family protein [Microterricola viridarii]AMB58961.1 hypothetical protein AWU67_08910 [Microterricola viridarii]
MNWLPALIGALALLAASTALGLLWRARTGRARATAATSDSPALTPAELADAAGTPARFGERATLLQFSTEYCARCPQTRALLSHVAAEHDGVNTVEIDLGQRADLARRFNVLQTPTILILDAAGRVRTRIGGAPERDTLRHAIEQLSTQQNLGEDSHVAATR